MELIIIIIIIIIIIKCGSWKVVDNNVRGTKSVRQQNHWKVVEFKCGSWKVIDNVRGTKSLRQHVGKNKAR